MTTSKGASSESTSGVGRQVPGPRPRRRAVGEEPLPTDAAARQDPVPPILIGGGHTYRRHHAPFPLEGLTEGDRLVARADSAVRRVRGSTCEDYAVVETQRSGSGPVLSGETGTCQLDRGVHESLINGHGRIGTTQQDEPGRKRPSELNGGPRKPEDEEQAKEMIKSEGPLCLSASAGHCALRLADVTLSGARRRWSSTASPGCRPSGGTVGDP